MVTLGCGKLSRNMLRMHNQRPGNAFRARSVAVERVSRHIGIFATVTNVRRSFSCAVYSNLSRQRFSLLPRPSRSPESEKRDCEQTCASLRRKPARAALSGPACFTARSSHLLRHRAAAHEPITYPAHIEGKIPRLRRDVHICFLPTNNAVQIVRFYLDFPEAKPGYQFRWKLKRAKVDYKNRSSLEMNGKEIY